MPAPTRRWIAAIARIGLGLGLGLALTEAGFWLRDGGGFPHMQTLRPDPTFAVALDPGASGAIRLGENPVAPYSIDPAGWRTVPGPQPSGPQAIVVVGDSQVFGLGVADDASTPAALATLTGRPVRNGGVPTWGPEEYLTALDQLLGETGAGTGVLVFNFGNDLFELGTPNHQRHGVLDGWAVRLESMPASAPAFPGRRWLMSQSHAVYAWRQWLHADPTGEPVALPSEGDWDTVLTEVLRSRGDTDPAAAQLEASLRQAARQHNDIEREQRDAVVRVARRVGDDPGDHAAFQAQIEQLTVGDVVQDQYAEASRPIPVTAEMLRRGAQIRRPTLARVQAWLAENPDSHYARRLAELESQGAEAQAALDTLTRQVTDALAAGSPYTGLLARAREITDRHGAELVVVALPLDVQIDAARFAEYGAQPIDMTGTLALIDALVDEAHAHGVRAVSLVEPLRAVGPGAFLKGDLHLTAAGHAAAAAAIAGTLDASPPPPRAKPSLADGRSRVPLDLEWELWEENLVRGSSRNACRTMRVREWQRVHCGAPVGPGDRPPAAVAPDRPEALLVAHAGRIDLVLPVVEGQDTQAWVDFGDRVERLVVPGDGAAPWFTPADVLPPTAIAAQQPEAVAALAACLVELGAPPEGFFGRAEPGCIALDGCAAAVSCAQGSRADPPDCPAGTVSTGSTGHCFSPCDTDHPCEAGACTAFDGGAACQ